MTLLSTFGGGLFIIPLLFLIGIVIWIIAGIRSSKSGSHYQNQNTGQYVGTPGNVPFVKTWPFKFALGLAIILIAVIIYMYSER